MNYLDRTGLASCPAGSSTCIDVIERLPGLSPGGSGSGGGGGGEPDDVPRGLIFQNQAMRIAYANSLQKAVRDKVTNDCQAMGMYVSSLVSEWSGAGMGATAIAEAMDVLVKWTFTPGLGVSLDVHSNTALGNMSGNETGQGSGFASEFQDYFWPDGDQAHHFAFFFQLGAKFPTLTADGLTQWMLSYGGELADIKNPGSFFNNQGDIKLAQKALDMGSRLARGKLAPNNLGIEMNQLCGATGSVSPTH